MSTDLYLKCSSCEGTGWSCEGTGWAFQREGCPDCNATGFVPLPVVESPDAVIEILGTIYTDASTTPEQARRRLDALTAAGYRVVQDFEGVLYGHSVKLAPPAEHRDGWRYCRIVDDVIGS